MPRRRIPFGVDTASVLRLVMVAVAALSTSACETFDQVPPLSESGAVRAGAMTAQAAYTVEAGDELLINSFYHPELKQTVTVQSDGRIGLLLVGTVVASGKTPGQLAESLKRGYGKFLENADVSVSVNISAGQAVYVGGEVAKPMIVPVRGELSLLQSIAEAGGFRTTANREQVLILRQTNEGAFKTFQVNAAQVLRNEAPEVLLKQHDIVYVPQSGIAQADQFVDQYINQIVPRAVQGVFGLQYNGAINSATSAAVSSNTTQRVGQ